MFCVSFWYYLPSVYKKFLYNFLKSRPTSNKFSWECFYLSFLKEFFLLDINFETISFFLLALKKCHFTSFCRPQMLKNLQSLDFCFPMSNASFSSGCFQIVVFCFQQFYYNGCVGVDFFGSILLSYSLSFQICRFISFPNLSSFSHRPLRLCSFF